jgi:hypothetical protein
MRDHRLVGGDQRLAMLDGIARQHQRRAIRPAHQFDHHIHIIARGHAGHVVFPGVGEVHAAILAAIARGNHADLHRAPGARNQIGIGLHQPNHARAHRAQPGKRNAQRRAAGGSEAAALVSVMVIPFGAMP